MSRPANAVYLSTPINALVEGFYTDKTSLGDVKAHGDFGLALQLPRTARWCSWTHCLQISPGGGPGRGGYGENPFAA
jgi:hypothetical protein